MPSDIANLNNIVRCTRYAFMPNRLHLCGPENQVDVLEFNRSWKNLIRSILI